MRAEIHKCRDKIRGLNMPEKLINIVEILDQLFMPQLALEWDNVGLLVGATEQRIKKVLLCIDYTTEVLDEAIKDKIDLVIAYHPPIFKPIKHLISSKDLPNVVYESIRHNIAIYSPHTALDIIDGGTSDVLADIIELEDKSPIEFAKGGDYFKLVVFVPHNALDLVSDALFQAGAGVIGEYSCCSFRTEGTGTFLGSLRSQPTIGKAGKFERVEEVRLEVLVKASIIDKVINNMLKVHPYEEPAYDIYPLDQKAKFGIGRMGRLKSPTTLRSLINRIKKTTGLKGILLAEADTENPTDKTPSKKTFAEKKIKTAAVCPGAGDSLLEKVAGKVDLFLTGEVRHHAALAAIKANTTVICLGHSNSERIALAGVKQLIEKRLAEITIKISRKDKDPFQIA